MAQTIAMIGVAACPAARIATSKTFYKRHAMTLGSSRQDLVVQPFETPQVALKLSACQIRKSLALRKLRIPSPKDFQNLSAQDGSSKDLRSPGSDLPQE